MTRELSHRALVVLVVCAAAAAAAGTVPEDAWARTLRGRGVDPALVPNPIALTPEIRAAARELGGNGGGDLDRLRRIQSALYDSSRFAFSYEAGATYTAGEALAARKGNCVSMTNLFIALARAVGIRVRAGYLSPPAVGEKRGDLVYVTAHVVAIFENFHEKVVFDFYRLSVDPEVDLKRLDDLGLAALTLNNRAVESLAHGDLSRAEQEFEAVVRLAPDYAAAHGNLGVVRRREGDLPGALDAYRSALALAPHDPGILGNLAALYRGLGREREAREALLLADLSRATPYTILARGDLEAADGRYEEALRFYRKAARAGPALPEPQIAIARLEHARGHLAEARRAAEQAARIAPRSEEARAVLAEIEGAVSGPEDAPRDLP